MIEENEGTKGRWRGREYCPHPGQPCIDGCYYCGREVKGVDGDHDHTKVSIGGGEEYSCVCETC